MKKPTLYSRLYSDAKTKVLNLFNLFLLSSLLFNLAGCGGGNANPVNPPPTPPVQLIGISISPSTPYAPVDVKIPYTATAVYNDGETKDITS